MSTAHPWNQAEPPAAAHCWSWTPNDLADLARVRREFRSRISNPAGGSDLPHLDIDRIEERVLALEELMFNGLRHGRSPVEAEVCARTDGVLIQVRDRDPDNPPQPTSNRDTVLGGMGSGLVAHVAHVAHFAHFALACGCTPRRDFKTVWALMPSTMAA